MGEKGQLSGGDAGRQRKDIYFCQNCWENPLDPSKGRIRHHGSGVKTAKEKRATRNIKWRRGGKATLYNHGYKFEGEIRWNHEQFREAGQEGRGGRLGNETLKGNRG